MCVRACVCLCMPACVYVSVPTEAAVKPAQDVICRIHHVTTSMTTGDLIINIGQNVNRVSFNMQVPCF